MIVTSATSAAGAPAASVRDPLGQADFIKLMTTQMRMQDPLDPVDNKEMIAQMAQFSSLAGIDDINQTLKAIAAQLDAVLAGQAATPTTPTP
jgi:flagellar basal-body rod modification protein FlgD